jgi:hypothetical protein
MRCNIFEFFIGTQPGVHPVSDADGASCHLNLFQLAKDFLLFLTSKSPIK